MVNSECAYNKACINRKCVDPCPGICGENAECNVINHNPICSCIDGFSGNAFSKCYPVAIAHRKSNTMKMDNAEIIHRFPFDFLAPLEDSPIRNPCIPSPCGLFSKCNDHNGVAVCSCLPNYYGSPPNCRPECTINSECPNYLACINQNCRDPCPGACGLHATCHVFNHLPMCTCDRGYEGDGYKQCNPIAITRKLNSSIILSESGYFHTMCI